MRNDRECERNQHTKRSIIAATAQQIYQNIPLIIYFEGNVNNMDAELQKQRSNGQKSERMNERANEQTTYVR